MHAGCRTIRKLFLLSCTALLWACDRTSPNTTPSLWSVSANGFATVGTNITVAANAKDSQGHPIAGAVITWAKVSNGGSLAAATSTTDASGRAQMTWTLGTVAGISRISATMAGAAPIVISENTTADTPVLIALVSGDSQTVVAGHASAPLIVLVTDQYNNPVPNVAVNWMANGGTTTGNALTDQFGRSTIILTTGPIPGSYVVTATASPLPPGVITFHITAN